MSAELAMYSGLIFYPICLIGFVIIVISLIRIAVSLNQIKKELQNHFKREENK